MSLVSNEYSVIDLVSPNKFGSWISESKYKGMFHKKFIVVYWLHEFKRASSDSRNLSSELWRHWSPLSSRFANEESNADVILVPKVIVFLHLYGNFLRFSLFFWVLQLQSYAFMCVFFIHYTWHCVRHFNLKTEVLE